MQTVWSLTDSRMALSRIVMYLRPLVVVDFDLDGGVVWNVNALDAHVTNDVLEAK